LGSLRPYPPIDPEGAIQQLGVGADRVKAIVKLERLRIARPTVTRKRESGPEDGGQSDRCSNTQVILAGKCTTAEARKTGVLSPSPATVSAYNTPSVVSPINSL